MGKRTNDRAIRDAMRQAARDRSAWLESIESADEADFDYADALASVRNHYNNT
jgi:hypothetical protein